MTRKYFGTDGVRGTVGLSPMTPDFVMRLGYAAGGGSIEFCKSPFPNELDLKGMKIVLDCAHGAAYAIAPSVFHELGADVSAIGAQPTASTSTTASAPLRRRGSCSRSRRRRP